MTDAAATQNDALSQAAKQAADTLSGKPAGGSGSGEKKMPSGTPGMLARVKALPLGAKIGSGVGAGILLVAGLPALLPVAIGGGALAAWYRFKGNDILKAGYSRAMNAERVLIFNKALDELKDPAKLQILADAYEKAGCQAEADHLRKRIALLQLPADVKKKNRSIYLAAMKSMDWKAVEKAAQAFKDLGADGASENLLQRAETLKSVQS